MAINNEQDIYNLDQLLLHIRGRISTPVEISLSSIMHASKIKNSGLLCNVIKKLGLICTNKDGKQYWNPAYNNISKSDLASILEEVALLGRVAWRKSYYKKHASTVNTAKPIKLEVKAIEIQKVKAATIKLKQLSQYSTDDIKAEISRRGYHGFVRNIKIVKF